MTKSSEDERDPGRSIGKPLATEPRTSLRDSTRSGGWPTRCDLSSPHGTNVETNVLPATIGPPDARAPANYLSPYRHSFCL